MLLISALAYDFLRPSARVSEGPADADQRTYVKGTWDDFEALLAGRGDGAGARMAYLDGEIELMSPSINHEHVKTTIARLVEAYADELEIDINGYGAWTLKNEAKQAGVEPDECYVLGGAPKESPDFAIEVMWSKSRLNKIEIYRRLGVKELWAWERRRGIVIHALRRGQYREAAKSAFLPELDLKLVASFALEPNQSRAVRELRAALRNKAR